MTAFTASLKSAIITAVKSVIANQNFFSNINQKPLSNTSQKDSQNNQSWAQIVYKITTKRVQKIHQAETIKNQQIVEIKL